MDMTIIGIIAVVVLGGLIFFLMKNKNSSSTNDAGQETSAVDNGDVSKPPVTAFIHGTKPGTEMPSPAPTAVESEPEVVVHGEESPTTIDTQPLEFTPTEDKPSDVDFPVGSSDGVPSSDVDFPVGSSDAPLGETGSGVDFPVDDGFGSDTPIDVPVETPIDGPIDNPEPPVIEETNDDSESVPNDQPVHILLVDDSKLVRIKTEKFLVANGYTVTTAIDGIDALDKMRNNEKYDIIITDIEMPNMDGFGLCKKIRENAFYDETPIMVMSSHTNLHLELSSQARVNGFVPKPYVDSDMLDQIQYLVKK